MSNHLKPRGLMLALSLVVLLAGAGVAYATGSVGSTHSNTIQGCYNQTNGQLRIDSSCRQGEMQVSWNSEGQPGPTGPAGPPGPAGAQGASGPTGANGRDGRDGRDGLNGSNGANGSNGPNGQNGANGSNGNNGQNGSPGTAGPAGPAGAKGDKGDPGTAGGGTVGPAGPQGPTGPQGPAGSQGPEGPSDAWISSDYDFQTIAGSEPDRTQRWAAVTLPAGQYVITALVVGDNNGSSVLGLRCYIMDPAGTSHDGLFIPVQPGGPQAERNSFTIADKLTLAASGSVSVNCTKSDPADNGQAGVKLIATKVGTVH